MRWSLWVIVLGVLGAFVFVRLAPSDPARWHVPLDFDEEETFAGGTQRLIAGDRATLVALDAVIRATPRTQILAGSVDRGHITYVTRSALWGFPDYATVQQQGDTIRIFSRLRFGRSDLGVNSARVERWLQRLGQG